MRTARPWLRALLILVSLFGVVATNATAGTPVDPNAVSDLIRGFFETGVLAYFSHAFYNSAFRRENPGRPMSYTSTNDTAGSSATYTGVSSD
jgi:hypothetical protein